MEDLETARRFFIEGVQLLEANDVPAAETQFTRSLEILPDRVSTLNNLSAVKIRLGKFSEAEALALKAVAADDQSFDAWSNLGIALSAMNRDEAALQAYDRSLACDASRVRTWLGKAITLLELKRCEEALLACDEASKLNPSPEDKCEILYTIARIMKALGRPYEARKSHLASLEMRSALSPVFQTERRPTQKADVLILSSNPDIDDSLKSFERLHCDVPNYASQLAVQLREEFHFSFIFEGNALRPAARRLIPRPDLVLNNSANGELLLLQGNLPGLVEFVDSFGVPVINHPNKAVQNTREGSAKLLAGAPGVLVPKTMRFSAAGKTREELVREIEEQYDYPMITRTLAFQEGKGMNKMDSRDALVAELASGLPDNFYVTQFVDGRGGNKFFRKIRAVFVRDDMIIVRVDFNSSWNVHGRKSEARLPFYLANLYLLDEEKRICRDPEGTLGRPAVQALQAIRDRIPLDIFGIDFDVNADGLVVYYEANASMNMFPTAQKQIPNPKEASDRLRQACQRYLASLVARR